MLPDVPLEYGISTNLAWNGMYSLPSGIVVKKQNEALKSLDDILCEKWDGNNQKYFEMLWDLMWKYYDSNEYKKRHATLTGITA